MKTRKVNPWLGVLVAVLLLASACGPKGESTPTLNVWITWGDNPAQLQALFDRYGEANGVKVVVNAPVEVDLILPALTGSNPPDVLILSGGDLVKSYANEGLVHVDFCTLARTPKDSAEWYARVIRENTVV